MLENASFVHVFGCMCMLELTITGWWIIVAYLSIPNWFELQLVSQLASYLFSYFLLRSLLPFSNSKFFLISCIYIYIYIYIYILDDVKKSSILKNGIGIKGQKSMQTSKKHVCKRIKMVLKC